jgi:hypothetical protein
MRKKNYQSLPNSGEGIKNIVPSKAIISITLFLVQISLK